MSPASKILKHRSDMLKKTRAFFEERGVCEVDCPALQAYPPIDAHIDPFVTKEGLYLHTSPEFSMKKLLAMGSGDIYQLSHVFRREEEGRLHKSEFSMLEWYRAIPYDEFIQETAEFISLFLGPQKLEILSYSELLPENLDEVAKQHGYASRDKDEESLTHFVWSSYVEPKLGFNALSIVTDFPINQAANAEIVEGVAKRFEIYFRGIELANGYLELRDPQEQLRRFETINQKRSDLGQNKLPIDPDFIAALEIGLPKCCGVAVGFDRLLMLHEGESQIESILPSGIFAQGDRAAPRQTLSS